MRKVSALIQTYASASYKRGLTEILLAVFGYSASIAALYISFSQQLWLVYGFACLTGALFMVKIFTLQHDCSHSSLLPAKRINRWTGRLLSLITTMPFTAWKNEHNAHHAHASDIELIKHGDFPLLTVEKYEALPSVGKLLYRTIRHPLFIILLAPFFYFFVKSKFPAIKDSENTLSVVYTNTFVLGAYGTLIYVLGFWTTFFVFVPAAYFGGIIGISLFYLQHNFVDAHWATSSTWDHEQASLDASSLIILPQPLEWFTHSIGYHHIHHLNSKIPGYKLQECYQNTPETRIVTPLSFTDVVSAFRLKLWSEKEKRLIPFSAL